MIQGQSGEPQRVSSVVELAMTPEPRRFSVTP